MPNAPRRFMPRNGGGRDFKPRERRGSVKERGYYDGWPELRARYFAEHPLCEDCLQQGVVVRSTYYVEVDHIIPFDGVDDPLRLDERNLRTRCPRHHRLKTAKLDKYITAFLAKQLALHPYEKAVGLTWAKYREALKEAA